MSLNLIDLIKGQLGAALVSQAATQLGESESSVSKAISGLLPAVVGGLANNANNASILDSVMGISSTGILGNLLGGSSNNSMVSTVLSSIFGDKVNDLVSAISTFSGVSNSSSNALLNIVTGATLGSVGKYAADNQLDRNGISSLLENQKGIISSLLPAGLSVAGLAGGLGSVTGAVSGAASNLASNVTDKVSGMADKVKVTTPEGPSVKVTRAESSNQKEEKGGGFLKWLLPLILLLGAGYFLMKQCNKKDVELPGELETTDSTSVEGDSAAVAGDTVAVVREATTVTLPNGKTLNAYKGGIEDQVVAFLGSDEYKNATEDQLKTRWFNFDNLNFEFGTTTLTAESQVQLDNLKEILAAFPDAKVKIGAYTDKKGDDAGNKTLSQKRADAVKAALGSAQVTGAEGYGEEFATVDENASDKEREADRKTSIRFVK